MTALSECQAFIDLQTQVDNFEGGGGAEIPADWRCEEVCATVGYVTVSAVGAIAAVCGEGITVTKTGTGEYEITSPPGAQTSISQVIAADNNSLSWGGFMTSFTQGRYETKRKQGNGSVQNVDIPFTIEWKGKRTQVVCDVVTAP